MAKPTDRPPPRGNCYVTCEALYHLLGGALAGYVPYTVRHEGDVHWYLVLTLPVMGPNGLIHIKTIVDPTASQFKTRPPYDQGRGRGFLTKKPSKRAAALMKVLVWQ